MNETAINIIYGIVVVAVLVWSIVRKNRRSKGNPLMNVARILMNLNRNAKLVERFSTNTKFKKFKTGAWKKNKDKVTFLPEELRAELARIFDTAEEFNGRIDEAKKIKSAGYLANIDLSRIKEPIEKSREQLREWFRDNMNNPEYRQKRRGLLG